MVSSDFVVDYSASPRKLQNERFLSLGLACVVYYEFCRDVQYQFGLQYNYEEGIFVSKV